MTYGLDRGLLAGNDDTDRRPEAGRARPLRAAVLHAPAVAPTMARSCSRGRPSRPARSRSTAGCTTATLARSMGAGGCRLPDARRTLIVSGGENVAPSEVEAVLESHPDVLEAAVVGRPDERWGARRVTAIVVARTGLRARCRGRCAPTAPRRSRRTRSPSVSSFREGFAAADAVWQAEASRAARQLTRDELRRKRPPRIEPAGMGRGGGGLGAQRRARAGVWRSGLTLDARRSRPPARPARARARRRPRGDGAARGPSSSRRSAAS